MSAPLLADLRRRIAAEGPITIAAYMADCLLHPEHGYYTTRESIGAAGDFTTAPEISQMFGELLGLWIADGWQRLGAPARAALVEFGPGRGTLMRDALRAIRALPGCRAALQPLLVEASPRLRAMQQQALAEEGATWITGADQLPADRPLLVLANEFLDALPIRQFQRAGGAWHERCVGLDEAGSALRFLLAPDRLHLDELLPAHLREAPEGAILESSPAARALIADLAARIVRQGGAALFVDYGHGESGFGDTLQAVRGHAYADPLGNPGAADLTAHVDFAALARVAREAGAAVHGPIQQGALLAQLGIAQRTAALKRNATPDQAAAIDAALHRLTAADAMGSLFKAMAITPLNAPIPAGFQ